MAKLKAILNFIVDGVCFIAYCIQRFWKTIVKAILYVAAMVLDIFT